MSRKNQVTFSDPGEPPFIQRMKQQIGWKEGPDVETKRESLPSADEQDYERTDPEEEKPAVVILKKGDLTAEEAEDVERELQLDDKTPGKFRFKKPQHLQSAAKNSTTASSSSSSLHQSSSTKRLSSGDRSDGRHSSKSLRASSRSPEQERHSRSENSSSPKPTNQRQLLSFGDDDEEES